VSQIQIQTTARRQLAQYRESYQRERLIAMIVGTRPDIPAERLSTGPEAVESGSEIAGVPQNADDAAIWLFRFGVQYRRRRPWILGQRGVALRAGGSLGWRAVATQGIVLCEGRRGGQGPVLSFIAPGTPHQLHK
jgi:hypothetical protein